MVERGQIGRYAYSLHAEDDDFGQAGTLVRDVLDDAERDRMVSNVIAHVSQDVSDDVIAVTTLSAALAMILGTVAPDGGSCSRPQQRLLGPGAIPRPRHLGYGMVAVSIVIWPGAGIVWKKRIQPKERT
jgi:hypothetical protein